MTVDIKPDLDSQLQSELLRLCVEGAPIGIAMVDRDMRCLAISRRLREDFGGIDKPMIGRSYYEILPLVTDRMRDVHRRCLTGASETCDEDQMPGADGMPQWWRWKVQPWHAAGGDVGGLVIFSENITSQRAERLALAKKSAEFDLLANSLPMSIASIGADLKLRYINRTGAEWLARPAGEALDRPIEELNPSFRQPSAKAVIEEVLAGKPSRHEAETRFPDGQTRWCEFIRVPERSADGTVNGYFAIAIDATARRLAEQARAEALEQYRLIVENVPVGIAYVDTDLRYRFVNRIIAQGLAAKPEAIIGRKAEEITPFLKSEPFRTGMTAALAGRISTTEIHQTFPDGVERWGDLTRIPDIGPDGAVKGYFMVVVDTTKRREAENERLAYYKRMRLLIDSLPALIAYIDRDARLQFVNRTFCEWHLTNEADVIGKTIAEVTSPDRFSAQSAANFAAALRGKPDRREIEIPFPDGRRRWCDGMLVPELDAGGEVQGVFILTTDITDRKRAESAKADALEQYRIVSENIPAGMAYVDTEQRIRFANKAAAAMLDRSVDQIVGQHVGEIIGLSQRSDIRSGREAALAGKTVTQEVREVRADGPERWFEFTRIPDIAPDGATTGYYLMALDISQRRQAEQEREAYHRRLRLVIDSLPVMIVYFDTNLRVVLANRTAAEWYGRSESESIGMTIREFISPSALRPQSITDLEAALQGRPTRGEFTLRFPNSRERICEMIREPDFDENGAVRGVFVMALDLTERKRADQARLDALEQYRMIVENIPVAVMYVGADRRFKFVNTTTAQVIARPASEVVGMLVEEALPFTAKPEFRAGMAAALAGQSLTNELFEKFPDGTERWAEFTRVPDRGTDGAVKGYYLLATETTSRRRAELERLAYLNRLRLVIDSIPALIVYFDHDLRLVMANRTACAWYAKSEQEIIGLTLAEILSPVDLDSRTFSGLDGARHGNPSSGELQFAFPDGKTRWCDILRVPDADEAGNVRGVLNFVLDITERKVAELKLAAAEARFSAFMQATPAAAWIKDEDRRYVYMNNAWSRQTGLDHNKWIGRELIAISDPQTAEQDLASDHTVLSTGNVSEYVARLHSADGVIQHWHRFKFLMQDLDGRPLIGNVAIDISKQKELETELHERVRQMRMVVSAGNVGLWDWDLTTDKVNFSDEWKSQIGYSPGEIGDGLSEWSDRIHPEDLDRTRHAVETYRGNPSTDYEIEFRIRHKNGTYRWILAKGAIVRDEQGTPVRFMGAHVDITERKEAEVALRTTLNRYRIVTENIPAMICHVDANLNIRFANHVAQQWFSRPEADLIGRPIADFASPSQLDDAKARSAPVLSGQITRDESQITFPDGVARWCDFTRVPEVESNGSVRGYFVMAIDITERKFAEERLRQSQKMEAIGQLAGGIAHDFNNLLMVISGNLEILVAHANDKDRKAIEAALRATRRGADMTRRLLAFSRKMPLHPEVIDVNQLVEDAAGLFENALPNSIKIETFLCETSCWALVDQGQLQNALLNLVVNARDAMPSGGRLLIRTAIVGSAISTTNSAAPDLPLGHFVRLTITDNGAGMSAEVKSRALEPYFTTKAIGKGSGLGLSMVYGFVEQSGGRIAIDSMPDRGTSIDLYFPLAADPSGEASASEARLFNRTSVDGPAILVVEDDTDVADVVCAQLSAFGYRVTWAADGHTAIDILRSSAVVDLLLSDVMLPGGLSGIDVTRQARELRSQIRCICMSGYAERHPERKTLEQSGVLFLSKPFSEEQLAEALAEAGKRPN